MRTPTESVAAVSQRLDTFFTAKRAEYELAGPEAAGFIDAAGATIRGGKQLRARFCLTGWRAVEDTAVVPTAGAADAATSAAASLEIFQAAALVHDDIVDNSDTRRGKPSAHRAFEADHHAQAWVGDAAMFGRSAAVLLGDLLVAWSDDLFEEGLQESPFADRARSEYARMRRDVTLGQYLDVAEESAYVSAPEAQHAERALRIASLKSARYSVEQPLRIGAALAGANDEQLDALSAFGHPVGMAFQLRDDVLGVFGNTAVTGKPSGDDLREGKRTVLMAYTREGLPAGARRTVDELVGDPGLDADQIASLQRTIIQSGALERVENLIADYARRADRALSGTKLGNAAVGELRDLARAATSRLA